MHDDYRKISRLEWTDANWADYLGCSVKQVQEYRNFLDKNFLVAIERNKTNNQYSFAMYRYHTHPSKHKSLQLMATRDISFPTIMEAVADANGIISCMELSDFWAKTYDVPKKVMQMLLIREK